MNTELEVWQVAFCIYFSENTQSGQNSTILDLLNRDKNDSLFRGAVARTFQAAYEVGYEKCLEELCG